MGKRSRKRPRAGARPPAPPASAPVRPAPAPPRRPGQSRTDRFVERADARPKPPWHPVPLVELSVLAGIVLLVVGLLNSDSARGRLAVLLGLVLASVAGLDTAAREHLTGFRSHSTLLAALPAVVAAVALGVAGVSPAALAPVGIAVFGLAFWRLRRAFRARAGVAFRV